MTEKRFTIKKDGIGQYTVSDGFNQFGMPITTEMNCKIIAYALNDLNDENEQLKQFQEKVFDLINKKIEEVDTIGAEVLKDLRKELNWNDK